MLFPPFSEVMFLMEMASRFLTIVFGQSYFFSRERSNIPFKGSWEDGLSSSVGAIF